MQNSKAFNTIASDKRWVNMMGVMQGVRQEINQLAPRPDRPDRKGPLSVKDDHRAAANDDRNGTLGGMLLESLTATVLGIPLTGWGNAVAVYDEARSDWAQSRAPSPAQGFRDMFNTTAPLKPSQSAVDKAWDRYIQDLPGRRVLEQSLGSLSREMDRIEKQNRIAIQRPAAYTLSA